MVAVSRRTGHHFSKQPVDRIRLLAGLGVQGDGHAGATVQHRSRVRRNPSEPNLRQVHLVHCELLDELASKGFTLGPGDIGENVLVRDLDLLALPTGTKLALGIAAVVELTGLRNPCVQLDRFADGLMAAVLRRGEDGSLLRLAGIMATVESGGTVTPGDSIAVRLPEGPAVPLAPV